MINKTSGSFILETYKRLLINCRIAFIPLVLLFFISSTSFAQSFFGAGIQNTPAQQNPAPSSSSSSPNQVMSADDYKNLVNNLGKQNQDSLTQSSQAQLNKQAPVIPPIEINPTTSAPTVEPAAQNNSSVTSQTPAVAAPPAAPIQQPPVVTQPVTLPPPVAAQPVTQPPVVAQPPVAAQPVAQPPVTTSVTSPTPSNANGSVMPTTPAAASTPSTNAPHSQAYTGFGNFGNTNNTGSTTNTNSSNGKSEGWNIHY